MSTLYEKMKLFTGHPTVFNLSHASRKQITIHNIQTVISDTILHEQL